MAKVALINGPNLNLLGRRKPELYGRESLDDIVASVTAKTIELGVDVWAFQSNGEGELVTAIQQAETSCSGIIINPAAYSHTSIAIRDALEACELPVIEVHMTNVFRREPFGRHSVISEVAIGVVAGLGARGYVLALDALAQIVGQSGRL